MNRRRVLALTLLAALSAQVAWAVPQRSTAELRALHCCAEHCEHTVPAGRADRCCGIEITGAETAIRSSLAAAPDPIATTSALARVDAGFPSAGPIRAARFDPPERAAPLFLLKRSLLL